MADETKHALLDQAADEDREADLEEGDVAEGDPAPVPVPYIKPVHEVRFTSGGNLPPARDVEAPSPPPTIRAYPRGSLLHVEAFMPDAAWSSANAGANARMTELVAERRQQFVESAVFADYQRLARQHAGIQGRLDMARERQQQAERALQDAMLSDADPDAAIHEATLATAAVLQLEKTLSGLAGALKTAEQKAEVGWAKALNAAGAQLVSEASAARREAESALATVIAEHLPALLGGDAARYYSGMATLRHDGKGNYTEIKLPRQFPLPDAAE